MTKEQIQDFSLAHAEPAWLADLRQAAFDQIDRLELPTIERVKFHRWNLGDGSLAENDAPATVPDFTALDVNPKLVQVGSQTVLEQLPVDLVEQGVVFTDLYSALELIPDVIEKHFGTVIKYDEDKMTAYNAAYFNATAVLYIPDNVIVDQPVEGIYYQDANSSAPFNKRVLIIAGKNSQVNYLERFESFGEGGLETSANITVEVQALAGSQVKFSAIDRLGKHVTTFMNRRGRLANDASIDWALGIMNQGNVVADFDSDLMGTGSHANLKVVALSSGRQVQGKHHGHEAISEQPSDPGQKKQDDVFALGVHGGCGCPGATPERLQIRPSSSGFPY